MELQNKVESVPSGIFTCHVDNREVGVVALGQNGLSIRYPKDWSVNWECAPSVRICYLVMEKDTYEEMVLADYSAHMEPAQEFYYQVTLYITGVNGDIHPFCDVADFVTKQYFHYVEAKLDSEGNEFSEKMCGYPASLDGEMARSYQEFLQEQYRDENLARMRDWVMNQQEFEVGISLEGTEDYKDFLEWSKSDKTNNKSAGYSRADVVYIGNQWCHLLFPKLEVLQELLCACKTSNKKIVVVFSYLRNSQIEKMQETLDSINVWCEQNQTTIEIVMNDYGMLSMLAPYHKWMKVRVGLLLNKRRKDPRIKYHLGYHLAQENTGKAKYLTENHFNTDSMQKFFEKNNVAGMEYESVGYEMSVVSDVGMDHALHLPLYQTNTSQFCTLYAMCKYGNRAVQKEVSQCPEFCNGYVFTYPKHLQMIGRYNSLFGVDHEIAKYPEWIKHYKEMGVHRIIWNMD